MSAASPDRSRLRGVFTRFAAPRRSRSRLRRRLGAGVRLIAALTLVGGLYTAFAPGAVAEDTGGLSPAAQQGKGYFDQSCASCHGINAQGVPGKGPSLIGVGSAAVEFQVSTGRMPLARQEAQGEKKKPQFTDDQARDIGAYIEALGGGPQVPPGADLSSSGDKAKGGELFRVNCASCHSYVGAGGALSSGKYAPKIDATDRQIYAAMLSGPQNMPVFGDNQLTPQEKEDIIAYIQGLKADRDPGGWGIGRLGPVPEALVIFLVGITVLIFAALWIAGKS
jgi:ubiquinol-cytochrome c reductase cytochrome c subunit